MKILLIDDHALFAKSLEIALTNHPQIEKFVATADVDTFLSKIQIMSPDIVLMDINLGSISNEDGLFLARKILDHFPDQKIVMLTGYDLPVYHRKAKKLGAKGFINKNVNPDELIEILTLIMNGGEYFSEQRNETFIEELTKREIEILQLASTGMKQKKIAESLYISERTVSNHLHSIFDKLQVSSTIEAVTKAVLLGYFTL